ncbi:MAG TPA: hypothetical protein VF219_19685 [Vicinamibacterales bacterium]
MLIAAASFALAVATTATAADLLSPPASMPPMMVSVVAASDVPARLVAAIVAETDAVWRGTGIQFFWERQAREIAAPSSMPTPYRTPMLRVQIGHERHSGGEWTLPLGWIFFDDPSTPEPEIYLSYENAVTLLDKSDGVVGPTRSMPQLQRETLLGRALGRALAHEIGHYLLASKVHTPKGLMMAVHSAFELFGVERVRFALAPSEQQRMVERFTSIYMASRG